MKLIRQKALHSARFRLSCRRDPCSLDTMGTAETSAACAWATHFPTSELGLQIFVILQVSWPPDVAKLRLSGAWSLMSQETAPSMIRTVCFDEETREKDWHFKVLTWESKYIWQDFRFATSIWIYSWLNVYMPRLGWYLFRHNIRNLCTKMRTLEVKKFQHKLSTHLLRDELLSYELPIPPSLVTEQYAMKAHSS